MGGFPGLSRWEGPLRSSPRIAEGHVFAGSDDGGLYAINLMSTRKAWRLDTAAAIRSTPFITTDYIYFGNEDGEFHCVDFRGQVKWKFNAKRGITSSPLVDGGTVYFTSLDTSIYALDARSGWVIWRVSHGEGFLFRHLAGWKIRFM